ncbi:MAG: 16S rRNA (cytosine(1402)-N(4))-methyltransferase RsmH [Longimicrobiaceae bacterium]
MSGYHEPVLVDEAMAHLEPERGGLFLDGTVGGGGHAEELLARGEKARLIAVDRDPEALVEAGRRLSRFGARVRFIHADFAGRAAGVEPGSLAGVLLDLGVSSHQIDCRARGFTFRPGAPLDMRMEAGSGETAADLLNALPEDALAGLLRRWGEEPRARRLARAIVRRRAEEPFVESGQLNEAVEEVLGARVTPQDKARIFQALRIAVNLELESLEKALPQLRDSLRSGGVLVVIAYHSLEDRVVKNSFREWSRACVCPPGLPVCRCRGGPLGEVLTRRPLRPTPDEVSRNPRARSARLRAWRRV